MHRLSEWPTTRDTNRFGRLSRARTHARTTSVAVSRSVIYDITTAA
jgi:hypothetical protein